MMASNAQPAYQIPAGDMQNMNYPNQEMMMYNNAPPVSSAPAPSVAGNSNSAPPIQVADIKVQEKDQKGVSPDNAAAFHDTPSSEAEDQEDEDDEENSDESEHKSDSNQS